MRRSDGEPGSFAILVRRLVELERHPIRAHALRFVGTVAPSRVETISQRLPGLGVQDLKAITPVANRQRELAAPCWRNGDVCSFRQLVGLGEARSPAALVFETPVIVTIFPEQTYRQR